MERNSNILNQTETKVLNWVLQGVTAVDIARLIGISENQAKQLLKQIYKKFNVCNRVQACLYAITHQI